MNMPPPAPQPKTSGLAIASLICSLLCLAIPGVICGHIGLSKIRKSAGQLAGEGIAIAGLIIGYIAIAASVIVVPMMAAITIPAFVGARNKAQEAQSMNHVRQISMECILHAQENDGQLPESLEGMETRALRSPLAPEGEPGKYQLVLSGSLNSIQDPAATPLVIDPHPTRSGGQITGFADGHVEVVGPDEDVPD